MKASKAKSFVKFIENEHVLIEEHCCPVCSKVFTLVAEIKDKEICHDLIVELNEKYNNREAWYENFFTDDPNNIAQVYCSQECSLLNFHNEMKKYK